MFQRNANTNENPADVIPPAVLATPSQVVAHPGEPIRWWRPGWRDCVRYVGYRWVFLAPAAALLLVIVWFVINRGMRGMIFAIGVELFLLVAGISFALAGYVIRRAVRARQEPFCIYCGYNLSHLPEQYRCPECGRPYTWELIAEYRRDPHWFAERYKAHRELPPPGTVLEAAGNAPRRRSRDGT